MIKKNSRRIFFKKLKYKNHIIYLFSFFLLGLMIIKLDLNSIMFNFAYHIKDNSRNQFGLINEAKNITQTKADIIKINQELKNEIHKINQENQILKEKINNIDNISQILSYSSKLDRININNENSYSNILLKIKYFNKISNKIVCEVVNEDEIKKINEDDYVFNSAGFAGKIFKIDYLKNLIFIHTYMNKLIKIPAIIEECFISGIFMFDKVNKQYIIDPLRNIEEDDIECILSQKRTAYTSNYDENHEYKLEIGTSSEICSGYNNKKYIKIDVKDKSLNFGFLMTASKKHIN